MNVLQKLRQAYENFEMTIAEGNYRTQPKSIWNLLSKNNKKLPETAEVMLGATVLDTSRSFSTRLLWAGAVAIASLQAMVWAAGLLGVIGIGVFVAEYMQSRRARNEVITEVNFAGQTVQGTRADLYHLHRAQVKMMNLGSSFMQASMESTGDTINRIAAGVTDYSKRVKILGGGPYGAGTDTYEFSEPGIKLVHDRPAPAPATILANDNKLSPAFGAKARLTEEEAVKRILELEESLPPSMQQKLQDIRAASQPKPQATA